MNSDDSFQRGEALLRKGRTTEAAACYRQALADNAADHRALHRLGALALQGGDLRAGESLLRSAVDLAPAAPEYRLSLGTLLQRSGRPRKALAEFRAATEADPEFFPAHFRLAVFFHRVGETDEALRHYQTAHTLNPKDISLLINYGALLNLVGRSADAVPLYEEAIELDASVPAAHGNLGNALASLNRHEEAIAAFQRSITLQPDQPQMYANLGSCLLLDRRNTEARHAFENCLRRAPGDITALAMLAALHSAAGDAVGAALLDYDRLLDIGPVPPPADTSLDEYLAALKRFVLEHPTLQADPDSHTTRDGQQTGALLPTRNPAMNHFVAVLRQRVGDYIARRAAIDWKPIPGFGPLWPPPRGWRLDMWATVLRSGGHQLSHLHPSGWLSGVFYVECPMDPDDTSQEGWIEFGQPPPGITLERQPAVHRHQPVNGELVLFPSYFSHRTLPLGRDRPRISIAFDVIPRRERNAG